MKLLFISVVVFCLHISQGKEESTTAKSTTTSKPQITEEDLRVVNETIKKYGPPKNYRELGLPGPELLPNKLNGMIENIFDYDVNNPLNYTIKIRTVTLVFNYNRRYEQSRVEEDEEIPVIKGQFGEHFERESGGYYIRTTGYVLDKSGYRQFLIDISTAKINTNKRISSAAIASLTGGGLG